MIEYEYEVSICDKEACHVWGRYKNPKRLGKACHELGLMNKEIQITEIDKEMESLTDEHLCQEHNEWLGNVMYYSAAEGAQWNAESADRSQANNECERREKELERREITNDWDESNGKLERAYRKHGKEIWRG